MGRFWRYFLPFQVWRFVVMNGKMFMIAKGKIGPHRQIKESEASNRRKKKTGTGA
jgi:hypothetical protein